MIYPAMPMVDYHAAEGIGSSRAKLVLDSVQLLKDEMDGLVKHESTASTTFGTLAHTAVLEPDVFRQVTTSTGPINPGTSKPYGSDTVKFAEWQKANPHLTIVSPSLYTMIDRMPLEIRRLLASDGPSEESVFTANDGVTVKCRPDKRINRAIYDLKTIGDIDDIDKHIRTYRYWFSAAWYRKVMHVETGEPHTFDLIFAETAAPHRWALVHLSPEYIEEGDYYVSYVLGKIARAQETGDWSDKSPIHRTATKPEILGAFDHNIGN